MNLASPWQVIGQLYKTWMLLRIMLSLPVKTVYFADLIFCAMLVSIFVKVQYWRHRYLSKTPVHQLQNQLGVRFYSTWYLQLARSALTRKEKLALNLYLKQGNFCNILHFCFNPSFDLGSNYCFPLSFQGTIKVLLHLICSSVCRILLRKSCICVLSLNILCTKIYYTPTISITEFTINPFTLFI